MCAVLFAFSLQDRVKTSTVWVSTLLSIILCHYDVPLEYNFIPVDVIFGDAV